MDPVRWAKISAVILGLAVVLGAFGAHALKQTLDQKMLEVYHTANFYHFIHGLALLLVCAMVKTEMLATDSGSIVGGLLIAGLFLFSGSLYLLAISGVKILGAITPLGGLCFIAAWAMLAIKLGKS